MARRLIQRIQSAFALAVATVAHAAWAVFPFPSGFIATDYRPGPGGTISHVATADVDQDGALDLLVADSGYRGWGQVYLLRGQGNGTFAEPIELGSGGAPGNLRTADFNHDGVLDVAFLYSNGGYPVPAGVAIVLSQPDGTFAPKTIVMETQGPFDIGDVNGDLELDLVSVTTSPTALLTALGNGDGTFLDPSHQPLPTGATSIPSTLHCGDMNGDGQTDITLVSRDYTSILTGNAATGFSLLCQPPDSGAYYACLLDWKHDGRPDVATGGINSKVRIWSVSHEGVASLETEILPLWTGPMQPCDIDADGREDLAMLIRDRALYIFASQEDQSLIPPVELTTLYHARAFAVADANGDGHPDVILGNNRLFYGFAGGGGSGEICVVPGTPRGIPRGGSACGVGGNPKSALVTDLNADGHLDLCVENGLVPSDFVIGFTPTSSLLLGRGDGSFRPAEICSLGAQPSSAAAADFDSDGFVDVVFSGAPVRLVRGKLGGKWQKPMPLAGIEGNTASGDIDHDGHADLVVGGNSGDVRVYLHDPAGLFSPPVVSPYAAPYVTLLDADSDGDLDIVTGAGGEIALLRGHGDGTFAAPAKVASFAPDERIVAADQNGDGVLDLQSGHALYFGDGNAHYAPAPFPEALPPDFGGQQVAADFSGDGLLDLAWINPPGGEGYRESFCIAINHSTTFEPTEESGAWMEPGNLASGDFNEDGLADLVLTNSNVAYVTILLNIRDVPSAVSELPPRASGLYLAPIARTADRGVRIEFALGQPSRAAVGVYDVRGRLVYAKSAAYLPAGQHSTIWDTRDRSGGRAARGVYIVRLQAGQMAVSRKFALTSR